MICQNLNMFYLNRTNYSSSTNKSSNVYKLVLVVVVVLLLGLLIYFPKDQIIKAKTKVNDLGVQSLSVLNDFNARISVLFNLGDYFRLHKKYLALQDENERLKQTVLKFSYLDSENRSLRKLYNFAAKKGHFILSTYMIRDSGFFNQEWRLLAGSKDGIKEGQVVLNNESLVGRVISVGEDVSIVLPITDVSSGISVLLPRSENRGILSGMYDGNLEIYILDKDVMPQQFDIVVSAGDGVVPPGLLVGTVSHISDSGTVVVRPLSILSRTNLISVVEY